MPIRAPPGTGVDHRSSLERRFRAMGSDVHVVVVGGSVDTLDRAVERIEQLESRWSRFRADSEVTMLNNDAGRAVAVSPDTRRLLVDRSIEAWRLTGGSFDPTLLDDPPQGGLRPFLLQPSAMSRIRPGRQPHGIGPSMRQAAPTSGSTRV